MILLYKEKKSCFGLLDQPPTYVILYNIFLTHPLMLYNILKRHHFHTAKMAKPEIDRQIAVVIQVKFRQRFRTKAAVQQHEF